MDIFKDSRTKGFDMKARILNSQYPIRSIQQDHVPAPLPVVGSIAVRNLPNETGPKK